MAKIFSRTAEVCLGNQSILWRGIYMPGHEASRIFSENNNWHLGGTAVFSHEGEPCRLTYLVMCDLQWNTLKGQVSGWLGDRTVKYEIKVDSEHNWRLNNNECPAVAGCIDLDLNFSPSTNLLPIRRLNLNVGQESEVNAAWLRFPSFELERLTQTYRRTGELTYHYESTTGFAADLEVNAEGFVINYPGIWQAEK
jgi:uncharacterized protein